MKKLVSLVFVGALLLVGCGSNEKEDNKVIKVGATAAPHAEILESIKDDLKEAGYTLEVKVFDVYDIPNTAVAEGELDATFHQHKPYLDGYNKDHKTELVSVAAIHFEPLGIYNKDTKAKNEDFTVADVKDGAIIAVPDDETNEARALQLLADKGIIKLKDGAGLKATKADITENPKNVDIKEVKAEGIPVLLPDVDYAVINGNYALSGKVEDKFIVGEKKDSEGAKTYANIVAVQKGNEKDPKIKALIKALTSEKTKKFIEDTYGDLVVASF